VTVVTDVRRDLKAMINGTPGTDLADEIFGLGGDIKAQWINQDRKMKPPKTRAFFLLKLDSWRKDQFADLLTETVPVLDELGNETGDLAIVFIVQGQRRFALEIRCESDSQADQDIAFNHIDSLMTGFESQRGRDFLAAAGIALVDFDIAGAINVDAEIDDRFRSHSVIRLEMRVAFCRREEPNNCWIQSTLSSSNVLDELGEPYPTNWENILIDGGV